MTAAPAHKIFGALATVLMLTLVPPPLGAQRKAPAPPASVRVYLFDCGKLEGGDPSRFSLKREEMKTTDMSVACYLVAHPRGTLMWDVGAVLDRDVTSPGTATRYHIVLPNGNERFVTTTQTLKAQLAAIGYDPADINYLALSHYHYDHTANANLFAGATWLVRQVERDVMFPQKPNDLTRPDTYSALRNSKTTIIKTDDYDVFGDGSVVMKLTPRPHARPQRVVREAGEDRSGGHLGRPVSLPRRTVASPCADVRRRSETDFGIAHSTRHVHERGKRPAVDPARPGGHGEDEEGSGVLRLAARCLLLAARGLLLAACHLLLAASRLAQSYSSYCLFPALSNLYRPLSS